MILSKALLQLIKILPNQDKKIQALNNIHIQKDGTGVVRNSKCLILMSPVIDEIKKKLKSILPVFKLKKSVTIPIEIANSVLKSLPSDKQFKGLLENVSLQVDESDTLEELKFILTDGKTKRSISGKKYDRKYIPYRDQLKEVLSNVNTGNKIVLNIDRLILLLQTIKIACPDDSKENPVFIEFTNDNDIILRAINRKTGQRVLSVMTSYKGIEGKWLPVNEWEKQFYRKGKKCKIKLKKKTK